MDQAKLRTFPHSVVEFVTFIEGWWWLLHCKPCLQTLWSLPLRFLHRFVYSSWTKNLLERAMFPCQKDTTSTNIKSFKCCFSKTPQREWGVCNKTKQVVKLIGILRIKVPAWKWCTESARRSLPWCCYLHRLIMKASALSGNTTAWASESSLILQHWGNNFDFSLLSPASRLQEYVFAGYLMAIECGVCHCAGNTHSWCSSRRVISYAVTTMQCHHMPCPVWDAAWVLWNTAGLCME